MHVVLVDPVILSTEIQGTAQKFTQWFQHTTAGVFAAV